MDLDISMLSTECVNTVHFYGALFREGDVWICMEVMDTSLDKFYPKIYKNNRTFPEDILGKVCSNLGDFLVSPGFINFSFFNFSFFINFNVDCFGSC